jgi:septum formation protein
MDRPTDAEVNLGPSQSIGDLVLASTSRYRRELLGRLGVPFRWRAPLVDEETLKSPSLKPTELAEGLARAKAFSIAYEEPEAVVLGGDQLVTIDGVVLGKPGSTERAIEQLQALSGRSHELITSIAVVRAGDAVVHTDVTSLTMRHLSRAEIERYVSADVPIDCSGSYKIEARGIVLFERIESADHSAISGLPLIALTTILRGFGFAVP